MVRQRNGVCARTSLSTTGSFEPARCCDGIRTWYIGKRRMTRRLGLMLTHAARSGAHLSRGVESCEGGSLSLACWTVSRCDDCQRSEIGPDEVGSGLDSVKMRPSWDGMRRKELGWKQEREELHLPVDGYDSKNSCSTQSRGDGNRACEAQEKL